MSSIIKTIHSHKSLFERPAIAADISAKLKIMGFLEVPASTQKCCMITEDDYKIIWDIDKLLNHLPNTNHSVYNRCVFDFSDEINLSRLDVEYAMNTNLDNPCIVAELSRKTKKIIDGHHRLYKARQLGVENIPCYILPLDYHKKFILNFDLCIYEKVVSIYENNDYDIKRIDFSS